MPCCGYDMDLQAIRHAIHRTISPAQPGYHQQNRDQCCVSHRRSQVAHDVVCKDCDEDKDRDKDKGSADRARRH